MSPQRLAACLTTLHWNRRSLAAILGAHETTVRRWADGTYPMPAPVAAWLDARARAMEAAPPPMEWNKMRGQINQREATRP